MWESLLPYHIVNIQKTPELCKQFKGFCEKINYYTCLGFLQRVEGLLSLFIVLNENKHTYIPTRSFNHISDFICIIHFGKGSIS